MLIVVAAGGAGETKSIMRARGGVIGAATCEWLAAGLCAGSPAIRRATRSAINRAGSSLLLTLKNFRSDRLDAGLVRRGWPQATTLDEVAHVVSLSNKSIRSTTPIIAESIAAPAFPVAVVEALQPS